MVCDQRTFGVSAVAVPTGGIGVVGARFGNRPDATAGGAITAGCWRTVASTRELNVRIHKDVAVLVDGEEMNTPACRLGLALLLAYVQA